MEEKIFVEYFDDLSKSPSIKQFFSTLEKFGDLIIIGGALRDISFNNNPRDIDIILSENKEFSWDSLSINYKKNRFGGAKINIDNIEFDFWLKKDNWANKNKYIENSIAELTKGTFFNIDSLVYDYTNRKLYSEIYLQCIENKTLDITLKYNKDYILSNPTPEINIIRAFYNKEKYNLNFSKEVINYINDWKLNKKNPEKILKKYELKHYKKDIFDENDYTNFLNFI